MDQRGQKRSEWGIGGKRRGIETKELTEEQEEKEEDKRQRRLSKEEQKEGKREKGVENLQGSGG
ncbi:hypothetical protein E2C01_084210 [Portunus trituberculatus]|uniref:Uncharacterized protein n=1 Tax=Portunus trituberculatus TaxID=210409 RepID=A0A5B7IZC1_PORTR|nr:hypothetical protein [Portunus trituberculatus]